MIHKKTKLATGLVFLIVLTIAFFAFNSNKEEIFPENKNPFLTSFYNRKDDYEQSFRLFNNIAKKEIVAGITSHHFLAKDLIANFFSGINQNNIKTIYIVGPDHFNRLPIKGKNIFIATTNTNWQTPYGVQLADKDKIQKILNFPKVSSNYQIFTNEHSIYILIPFIKKVFHQAKIVPIIVRNNLDYKYFYNFGTNLSSKNSLLIISSDFSHYSTLEQCRQNDTQSISLLSNQNFDQVNKVKCDCTQCISLLYGFLSNMDTDFELIENKNSTDYGEKNLENITSYVNAYFIKK